MVENLFINGCSFLQIYDDHRCPTTAGHHLAETIGLNPIGYALSGRGNDRIVATTKLFFYDNPELIKDTFALIGWSHVVRNDYLKEKSPLRKSPKEGLQRRKGTRTPHDWGTWKLTKATRRGNKYFPSGYDINKSMRLRYLEQVLSLQDFFKLNNINYCMYNALTNRYNSGDAEGLDRLADKVDKQRFFGFDVESHLEFVQNSIKEPGIKNRLTLSDIDDHPSHRGHRLWGDKLHAFIKENGLL